MGIVMECATICKMMGDCACGVAFVSCRYWAADTLPPESEEELNRLVTVMALLDWRDRATVWENFVGRYDGAQ